MAMLSRGGLCPLLPGDENDRGASFCVARALGSVGPPGSVVGAILLFEDIAKSLGHIDRRLATVIRPDI